MKRENKNEGWYIFLIMCFLFAIAYFHRVSLAICASKIIIEFSIQASTFGLLSSLYFYAYGFSQFPFGLLVDKFGPKKITLTASLISTAGIILFIISRNFVLLSIGRFLIGLGSAGVWVPTAKLISNWFPKTMFGKLNGINGIAGSIGGFLATTPLAFAVLVFDGGNHFLRFL